MRRLRSTQLLDRTIAVVALGACIAAADLCTAAETPKTTSGKEPLMKFTVSIDRGPDVGQNFGSLFEVKTTDGRFVLGAGFLGLYNTRFRSDRHAAHFFVRPTDGKREITTERLPRPTKDAGAYMFGLGGTL